MLNFEINQPELQVLVIWIGWLTNRKHWNLAFRKFDWLILKFRNTFLHSQPEINCIQLKPRGGEDLVTRLIKTKYF